MERNPIFIGITRSFWSFMATAALIMDLGEPVIRALATAGALVFGYDVDDVTARTMEILPLVTLAFAMQQRSGASRPYTMDPRAVK